MKGQLSLETMFAVGVVLVLFIMALSFSFVKKQELLETQQVLQAKAECLVLADMLSSMLTLGPTSNASLHLYFKHSVSNSSSIRSYNNDSAVELTFCNYMGVVGPYTNLSGDVHVQNVAGNVSVVLG